VASDWDGFMPSIRVEVVGTVKVPLGRFPTVGDILS
jgi:hypothetical protein